MKVAGLKCSGGLNQGNDFINFGGQFVLENLHPKDSIEYFEFYDSCLPQWKTKEILTASTVEYIRENFDIIYVFSGSAGSPVLYTSLFKKVDEIGLPFVLLVLVVVVNMIRQRQQQSTISTICPTASMLLLEIVRHMNS